MCLHNGSLLKASCRHIQKSQKVLVFEPLFKRKFTHKIFKHSTEISRIWTESYMKLESKILLIDICLVPSWHILRKLRLEHGIYQEFFIFDFDHTSCWFILLAFGTRQVIIFNISMDTGMYLSLYTYILDIFVLQRNLL